MSFIPPRVTDPEMRDRIREVDERIRRVRFGRLTSFLKHVSPALDAALAAIWAYHVVWGGQSVYARIAYAALAALSLWQARRSVRAMLLFRKERREAIVREVMES